MDQQYTAMSPSPPSPPKVWTWKETLSVVFLVLSPIIGLILMWAIANWTKKVKIILTAVLLIPVVSILSSIVLVSVGGAREAARDASRKADMRMMVTAQEMYYSENDAYYTSVSYPSSIGSYMPTTPVDPKTNGSYGWVDNTGDNQRFCAYADLEKNGFYAAANAGNYKIAAEPRTLSDCEKFSNF